MKKSIILSAALTALCMTAMTGCGSESETGGNADAAPDVTEVVSIEANAESDESKEDAEPDSSEAAETSTADSSVQVTETASKLSDSGMTAGDILGKCQQAVSEVKSFSNKINAGMNVSMTANGTTENQVMMFDMNGSFVGSNGHVVSKYKQGDVSGNYEQYSCVDGDKLIIYSNDKGSWEYSTGELNELAGDLNAMFSGYSIGEHAKLSYEDSCYVITVDLADLPEMTDGLDFFGIGVSDSSDGTLMYKIDAESFLPAEIKLSNMTNVLTSQDDESMSYRVVLQASYDMFFSEWNSVSDDRVAVPDDVKSTATESVYSIDWGVTDER